MNNSNNNNNGNMVAGISSRDLLKKIQQLAFAKVETELYLNAHPECTPALDYYKSLIREYRDLATRYEEMYGPIRAENVSADHWTWVDMPWPWQLDGNGRES